MPRQKTGRDVLCPFCGATYYRSGWAIQTGRLTTCGARECKHQIHAGERNPFWGKSHDEATRERIRGGRARNPPKNPGPRKGGFKHTAEAKARIAAASKRLWLESREKMLAKRPRGPAHHFHKDPDARRYRKNWSPGQLKDWLGERCEYCNSTEDLVLDHIIPIFDGGTNVRFNAQTLCRGCNLWKTKHVDLPRFRAAQAAKGAEANAA